MARPTDTPTDAPTDAQPAAHFQDVLVELATDALDAWYDAHPSSNAYGCDYDGTGTDPDGTFFMGRDGGPDGSGVDYIMRRFPDPESRDDEREYIYGKYGFMDANELVDEVPLLGQLFAEAVDRDLLTEDAVDRFDAAADGLEDALRQERDQYDLDDLAQLFQQNDVDTLRTLLAHGDEEGRVVWSLCKSKSESGETVDNVVEVPVLSEQDQFMLVRTERYYVDDHTGESKHYAYGAVVGYDDTPERFFVHRLESDEALRDPDYDWTAADVRERMGFDYNLSEVDGDDLPYDERVRLQGDLMVVRRDYERALAGERDRQRTMNRNRLLREYGAEYDAYDDVDGVSLNSHTGRPRVYPEDTDELTAIQDDVGLPEGAVRREQDDRGWDRLTAGRRREIVEELLTERVYEWACEQSDTTRRALKSEAATAAIEAFESTESQVNLSAGNHVGLLSGATEHPDPSAVGDGVRACVVVPDESGLFLIHDEHRDVQLSLGPGVYEFGFLEGFQDEFWM